MGLDIVRKTCMGYYFADKFGYLYALICVWDTIVLTNNKYSTEHVANTTEFVYTNMCSYHVSILCFTLTCVYDINTANITHTCFKHTIYTRQ